MEQMEFFERAVVSVHTSAYLVDGVGWVCSVMVRRDGEDWGVVPPETFSSQYTKKAAQWLDEEVRIHLLGEQRP